MIILLLKHLYYLSLLNDFTYKIKNYKLIKLEDNIKSEIINIKKINNTINDGVKNIINMLYQYIGSIVLIDDRFYYVYNIEIINKEYHFNIFTIDVNNKIIKNIILVELENYKLYKYKEYNDFNNIFNIIMLYLIDNSLETEINECIKNISKKDNDDIYYNERIFFCVIYKLYMNIYNTINIIYGKKILADKPFLNKKCCECKRNSGNTFKNNDALDKIDINCFLHAFTKFDLEKLNYQNKK